VFERAKIRVLHALAYATIVLGFRVTATLNVNKSVEKLVCDITTGSLVKENQRFEGTCLTTLRIREQAMQGIRIHLAYSLTVKMEAT
jgi:hypothetical protein